MFEVVVSDRFAVWYEGLSSALAEEVTLALEVAARLGATIDPARHHELLLWFDGCTERESPELAWVLAESSVALGWGHRVATCLESSAFRERLAALEPEQARDVLVLVERMKRLLVVGRVQNTLAARAPARAGGSARGAQPEPVHLAALEALRLVGLSPGLFLDAPTGLRELQVGEGRSSSRLLCGVDVPRRRVIAIVGEALDRHYYGDSVRFAEAYFRDYLAQPEAARASARGT
jgi:hypothetical protein